MSLLMAITCISTRASLFARMCFVSGQLFSRFPVCSHVATAMRYVVQVQERFRNAYQEVKTTMAQLYSFFQTDSEEVQREWLKFTQKVCYP